MITPRSMVKGVNLTDTIQKSIKRYTKIEILI